MIAAIIKTCKQYHVIASNFFFLSVVEGIKLIMPFIAMPYIIHVCGASNYGKIVFAQAIMTYFTMLVNFGLNVVTVKEISDNLHVPEKISQIISSFLTLRFILVAAGLIILFLLTVFLPLLRSYRLLLLFCYIAVVAEGMLTTAFFQGIEKMHNITLIQTFAVIFYISTLFIFVRRESDYIFVPLLQSTGLFLSAVAGIILMITKYHIKLCLPQAEAILQLFKKSITFAISRLSVAVTTNMAKLFTGLTLGMQEVALLDLAQKISDAALLPASILDQAIYPYNAKKQDRLLATKMFVMMLIVGCICAAIMFLGIPLAVRILGAGKLGAAIPLAYWLCIRVIINVMVLYTGTPLLVAFGYPRPFNFSVIICAGTMILLYLLLYVLNQLSLYAFVALLIINDLIILVYRLFYCLKYKILSLKIQPCNQEKTL